MPPVIYPYWLVCIVNHNLLKILILKKYLYVAKANVLLQDIVDQHVYGFLVCGWEIFLQQNKYAFLELALYDSNLRLPFSLDILGFLSYEFLPDFLKNYLSGFAYVCYGYAVYRHRLFIIGKNSNPYYDIIDPELIRLYYFLPSFQNPTSFLSIFPALAIIIFKFC